MSQTDDPRAHINLDPSPAPRHIVAVRLIFFLLFLAVFVYWQMRPTREDRIAQEAKSYLATCPSTTGAVPAESCMSVASDFENLYSDAMAGDRSAQLRLAHRFYYGSQWVPQNRLQACAWGVVLATGDLAHASVHAYGDLRAACAELGADGWALANDRGKQLRAAIQNAD